MPICNGMKMPQKEVHICRLLLLTSVTRDSIVLKLPPLPVVVSVAVAVLESKVELEIWLRVMPEPSTATAPPEPALHC